MKDRLMQNNERLKELIIRCKEIIDINEEILREMENQQ